MSPLPNPSQLPLPKLPHLQLPEIRMPIHIPFLGCAVGDGKSYMGEQFGNMPDLEEIFGIKTLKKAMDEQVYALIQGQLPDTTRPPIYGARAAEIIEEIVEQVQAMNEMIGDVLEEVEAVVTFIAEKQAELQGHLNYLQGIPTDVMTEVQTVMMAHYEVCFGELDDQVTRMQSTLGCLVGL